MESRYSSVIGVIELKINPQTAPRSRFFSHHPVRTAALSFILSVWTFLMFLHSVLTFCGGNTHAPVEQVEQSQILYGKKLVTSHNIKDVVFFREALIKVSFTKPIKRMNTPTHSALLKADDGQNRPHQHPNNKPPQKVGGSVDGLD